MEDKLLELKNEFCKYYCNGIKEVSIMEICEKINDCRHCDKIVHCDDWIDNFHPCDYCKVNDFIRHIRDDL